MIIDTVNARIASNRTFETMVRGRHPSDDYRLTARQTLLITDCSIDKLYWSAISQIDRLTDTLKTTSTQTVCRQTQI